jgi:hypothetical protein
MEPEAARVARPREGARAPRPPAPPRSEPAAARGRDRGGRRREEEPGAPVTGFGADIPAFMLVRARSAPRVIAEEPETEA